MAASAAAARAVAAGAQAVASRSRRGAIAAIAACILGLAVVSLAAAAGPPFSGRDPSQPVRDDADILDQAAVEALDEAILRLHDELDIDAVVYVQKKPTSDTFAAASADARALADAWAVGSGAQLDGLVVLVDLDESSCHGQLVLYADDELGARISNRERQQIFDEQLLPLLKDCQIGGAIQTGLEAIEARLTGLGLEPSGDVVEPSFDDSVGLPAKEPPFDGEPPADEPVEFPNPSGGPQPGVSDGGGLVALIAIAGIVIAAIGAVAGFNRVGRGGATQMALWPFFRRDDNDQHGGPFGGPPSSGIFGGGGGSMGCGGLGGGASGGGGGGSSSGAGGGSSGGGGGSAGGGF